MKKMLQDLREVAVKAILGAADPQALEALRIPYLGKKGELTKLLKNPPIPMRLKPKSLTAWLQRGLTTFSKVSTALGN